MSRVDFASGGQRLLLDIRDVSAETSYHENPLLDGGFSWQNRIHDQPFLHTRQAEDPPGYFDLEDPLSLVRLDEPMTALGPLKGLIVIDEVQRRPDLFPTLRVLADRKEADARFLILGSASGVSGRCWRTTMAKPGMPLNRHVQWASANPRPGGISIF